MTNTKMWGEAMADFNLCTAVIFERELTLFNMSRQLCLFVFLKKCRHSPPITSDDHDVQLLQI